jgi:hypothetical protein
MINQIRNAYVTCDKNSCHLEFKSSFYLNDHSNGKCEATQISTDATCFIENSSAEVIHFFAIDDCIIDGTSIKRCDAAVSKKNIIWFIELKEVNWSSSTTKNREKRKKVRKKAVIQIASTINDFKSKGIDFSNYLVAGLISFPPFTISNPTSTPSTSSQARILEFSKLCGYTELHEGNYIVL